ncbi:peptidoglycan recognition family protein [Streptomyces sp. NBC_01565]|uniref:peptidoglycan recognition protein family protein n=1 Tax=unclassified Streptomyces TaxID=2593676 RepID=UPI00224CCF6E|nr:peptidoglycan recognition family protein [Streptomyces sp. NBC_01565]MCX4539546.1 peptidoglycan recognition protein family protein [Streptomyces sp. NBC_01565]
MTSHAEPQLPSPSSRSRQPLPPVTRRTILAGALGLGAAALLPSATPARASAAATPEIFGCATWGARAASESVVVLATPPLRIIVHHTATANGTDYSKDRAFALARAIQNYHMDTHGWIDTGQHFTVSRGAYVTEGRHRSLAELNTGLRQVRSAHCVGQNTVSIGIENEGTYTSVEPPAKQFAALGALCAQICRKYGLPPSEIYGHRDFNDTACPGDRLYAMLPRLRQEVATQLSVPLLDQLWEGAEEEWDRWPGPSEFLPDEELDRELERSGLWHPSMS